jgi:hypothetical protein
VVLLGGRQPQLLSLAGVWSRHHWFHHDVLKSAML